MRTTELTLSNGRTYLVKWQPTTKAQLKVRHPRCRTDVARLVTFQLLTEVGSTGGHAPSAISAESVFKSNHLTGIVTREAFTAAGGVLS